MLTSIAIVLTVGCTSEEASTGSTARTGATASAQSTAEAGTAGIDLVAIVERTMPGVNIIAGSRADAVFLIVPNPSAEQFRRLIDELGLPADLYDTMSQSHEEAVTHTVESSCCVATWAWSSDDGLGLDLHLHGIDGTLATTEIGRAPTST